MPSPRDDITRSVTLTQTRLLMLHISSRIEPNPFAQFVAKLQPKSRALRGPVAPEIEEQRRDTLFASERQSFEAYAAARRTREQRAQEPTWRSWME